MENTERIAALGRLITKYQDSYYNGEAEISDEHFDLLCDELRKLDPENPALLRIGADGVDGFPKAPHLIPMGSQEKAAAPEEFRLWAEKTAALPGFGGFIVQYKLDGASLELQYENGALVRAVTRGDGAVGDDITPNARRMKGVAAALKEPFSGGVRGEVIMTRGVWREKYADKANCRNAANGLMRRKDGEGSGDLSLVTYDAAAAGDDAFFADEAAKLAWLARQGFITTPAEEIARVEDIIAYREKTAAARDGLPYDIDGLVVKDKHTPMADLRRARPERQIAFKFDLETAFSILREVEWSESGVTYTPIGILDPVRLAGTTVKRANLNNPDMIRAMGLRIGSAVAVVKRGEIIPKIEGLAPAGALPPGPETDIAFPETCSSCGAALLDEGTRLYCPNPDCPKRLLHRLEKWVSVLDIRELGDKLLRQLFDKKRVRDVSGLYTLGVEELAGYERMGEASARKVIRHIRTPREISLAAFVAGFDFEGVGEQLAARVVAAGYDTLARLRAASAEALADVHGIGEVTARAIAGGLAEAAAEMDRVLAAGVVRIAAPLAEEAAPLRGKSFCFTGELKRMKRAEAEARVRALGGAAKSSVGSGLSYLVTNDPESGSAKNKRARELGVRIIDEAAFLSMLDAPAPEAQAANPAAPELPGLFS